MIFIGGRPCNKLIIPAKSYICVINLQLQNKLELNTRL